MGHEKIICDCCSKIIGESNNTLDKKKSIKYEICFSCSNTVRKVPQEIIERVRGMKEDYGPDLENCSDRLKIYNYALNRGFNNAIDEVLKVLEGK